MPAMLSRLPPDWQTGGLAVALPLLIVPSVLAAAAVRRLRRKVLQLSRAINDIADLHRHVEAFLAGAAA